MGSQKSPTIRLPLVGVFLIKHSIGLQLLSSQSTKMWRKQLSLFFRLPKKLFDHRPFQPGPTLNLGYSSSTCNFEVAQLKSRSLVRIRGSEAISLLQGLITNDVSHLEQKSSIFTLFLNHQGRVLFDALLHKPQESEPDTLLLECDSAFRSKLISHLKLYRLKRKVDIEAEDQLSVWVVYDAGHLSSFRTSSSHTGVTTSTVASYDLSDYCCKPLTSGGSGSSQREDLPVNLVPSTENSVTYFGDPRLSHLGWRIFGPCEGGDKLFPTSSLADSEQGYKALRYLLGVGEGVVEIPFGAAFPLEANGDFLHGISFHKGCYLGQELTARTHHTGVVRKRLMPFRVTDASSVDKILGDVQSLQILNEKNRPVGKVRGLLGNIGIALFRIEETLSATSLTLNEHLVTVPKPTWWPVEASKELTSGRKS